MPIEVSPVAYSPVLLRLKKLGAVKAGLRMGKAKAGPVVTDNGNFNIDAVFTEEHYRNVAKVRSVQSGRQNPLVGVNLFLGGGGRLGRLENLRS